MDTVSGLELEEQTHLAVLHCFLFVCLFFPNEPDSLIEIKDIETSKGENVPALSSSLFLVLPQQVLSNNPKVPIPHESPEGENGRSSKQSLISSLPPAEMGFSS